MKWEKHGASLWKRHTNSTAKWQFIAVPFFLSEESEEKIHKKMYNHSIFYLKLNVKLVFFFTFIVFFAYQKPFDACTLVLNITERHTTCQEMLWSCQHSWKDICVYEYLEYCGHTDSFCQHLDPYLLSAWDGFPPWWTGVCVCIRRCEDVGTQGRGGCDLYSKAVTVATCTESVIEPRALWKTVNQTPLPCVRQRLKESADQILLFMSCQHFRTCVRQH